MSPKKSLIDAIYDGIQENSHEVLLRLLVNRPVHLVDDQLAISSDGWIVLVGDGKDDRIIKLSEMVDSVNHWTRDEEDTYCRRSRKRLSKILRELADDLDKKDSELPNDFWK